MYILFSRCNISHLRNSIEELQNEIKIMLSKNVNNQTIIMQHKSLDARQIILYEISNLN